MLVNFPEMARERNKFTTPLRIHPSRVYLVIYKTDGKVVDILRILYAHQNLTAYLIEG